MGSDPPNPYAPPLHEPSNDVAVRLLPTIEGSRLRFGKTTKLAKVCVGCGTTKRVKERKEDFEYFPPVLWLAFPFIGVFVGWLIRATTRRAQVRFSRCGACEDQHARIKMLRGPASLIVVVVLLIAATFAGNGFPWTGAIIALISIPVFFLGMRRWLSGGLRASYIDEHTVTLEGVHPKALALLASHEHERSRPDADPA